MSNQPQHRVAVIGGGVIGVSSAYHLARRRYGPIVLLEKGPGRVSPLLIPMDMPNGPAAHVGLLIGARAGVFTPVSACACLRRRD